MILTTGEIGLVAVGATLFGVFATQYVERRRFTTTRKERWFERRSDAYETFLHSAYNLNEIETNVIKSITNNSSKSIQTEDIEKYQTERSAANRALATVRTVGSSAAREKAGQIVASINNFFEKVKQVQPGQPTPQDKLDLQNLRLKSVELVADFVKEVRKEFGVEDEVSDLNRDTYPELGVVLIFKWVRKKFYESYIRAEEQNKK